MGQMKQTGLSSQAKFGAMLLWGGGLAAWLVFFLLRSIGSATAKQSSPSVSELAAAMTASTPADQQNKAPQAAPSQAASQTAASPRVAPAARGDNTGGRTSPPSTSASAEPTALEAALARRPELQHDRLASAGGSRHAGAGTPAERDAYVVHQPAPLPFSQKRKAMVEKFASATLAEPHVQAAFQQVAREYFVPRDFVERAYEDTAIELGAGRRMVRPQVLAAMTQLAELKRDTRVLNVGSQTGYAAAVLSKLANQVYAVESNATLVARAKRTLESLGYGNVEIRHAEAMMGWTEEKPFDVILVCVEPTQTPHALLKQLARGGRMIVATGSEHNEVIYVVERNQDGKLRSEKIPTAELLKIALNGRRASNGS